MKRKIIVLILFFLTNFSNNLFACDCKEQKTVAGEIQFSDAVLVGTVFSKKLVNIANTSMNYMTVARYDLLVQNIYKGKLTNDTLTIFTGVGVADCGVSFEVGKNYVVYGKSEAHFGGDFKYPKGQNTFWTSSCQRTRFHNRDEINEIEKYVKMKLKS